MSLGIIDITRELLRHVRRMGRGRVVRNLDFDLRGSTKRIGLIAIKALDGGFKKMRGEDDPSYADLVAPMRAAG